MAPEDNPAKTDGKPRRNGIVSAAILGGGALGATIVRHFVPAPSEFWTLFVLTAIISPIAIICLIAVIRPYFKKS
jgi:hypothetical protein